MKKATINDMAEFTGLSTATISRCINNTGYVSEESRELIKEAQQKLNFYPRRRTRTTNSATATPKYIMLVLPENNNPFWYKLINSVQNVAREKDYYMILNACSSPEEEIKWINSTLQKTQAAGYILVTLNDGSDIEKYIYEQQEPIVLCGFIPKLKTPLEAECDRITVDTQKGTFLATKHVLQMGRGRKQRICYADVVSDTKTGEFRKLGFRNAIEEAGIPYKPEMILPPINADDDEYPALVELYERGEMPDAICAGNDKTAFAIYQTCKKIGISIPDELMVVGLDNTELCQQTTPRLTSVDISPAELGTRSAEMLFEQLGNTRRLYQQSILEPRLIIRESSKA